MMNVVVGLCSGTKGIQRDWKFSAKAGCQNWVIKLKVFCFSAMAMVIHAPFSLKVC